MERYADIGTARHVYSVVIIDYQPIPAIAAKLLVESAMFGRHLIFNY